MAAFNYILFFTSLIILFPIFRPRTVSTIRIHHELTPSKHSGDAAAVNRNMLAADHHNVAVPPHGSHGIVIGVLKKGRITPSGPSHRGNTIPIYTTRHDGVGHR
ncbi:hypothetical protein E1A91_D10G039700v1 [Gossypium mustelinum]|uniref:Uncharacterized protein n=1 Tax=Gossypium mustelinum TaxID=34275 RepID=A0A5D2T3K5_GOSMU|nr:hypothetical protein E1A91_D10G039700v1 [Gossypium mustelinum]